MSCPTTVHNNVCVDAEVTITPVVTVGEIRTFCNGGAQIGSCPGTPSHSCSFNVRQSICAQVPLTFEADATATPLGIVCDDPAIGSCGGSTSCTYTIGFYRNHPEVTEDLLAEASGSIVLGNSVTGLGFTVTTVAEAIDVLNINIPSSALPPSMPQILFSRPPHPQALQVLLKSRMLWLLIIRVMLLDALAIVNNQVAIMTEKSSIITKDICTDTTLTLTPTVHTGGICSRCIGPPEITKCPSSTTNDVYQVSQLMLVSVSLIFSTKGSAKIRHASTNNPCPSRRSTSCRRGLRSSLCCCLAMLLLGPSSRFLRF